MLSVLDILLLILAAQSASAGPVRRYLNTTSIELPARSSLPSIVSVSSSYAFTESTSKPPSRSSLASSQHPPVVATSSVAASSGSATGNINSLSTGTSITSITRPIAANISSSIQNGPSTTRSPTLLGAHRGQTISADPSSLPAIAVTRTTTFTTTKTILPPSRANLSDPTPGIFNRPTFTTHRSQSGSYHGTGFHNRFRTSSSFLPSSSSFNVASSQSSLPAPTTASFVLGSSTFQVTVSQGPGNIGSSSAPFDSDSTTTVHITRMSTILLTTTATTPLSASSSSFTHAHHDRPHAKHNGEERPTLSSSTPTSFPTFTFRPTSSSNAPSSRGPTSTTPLPPIVSISSGPESSAKPTFSSSTLASQEASSSLSSSLLPSSSSSVMAGITIVPVDPGATTVYLTVTETQAGVTTTVAKGTVTVTARPSHHSHWHHWRWHGKSGG